MIQDLRLEPCDNGGFLLRYDMVVEKKADKLVPGGAYCENPKEYHCMQEGFGPADAVAAKERFMELTELLIGESKAIMPDDKPGKPAIPPSKIKY